MKKARESVIDDLTNQILDARSNMDEDDLTEALINALGTDLIKAIVSGEFEDIYDEANN